MFLFVDIMNKKPRLAWELYLKMETSAESFSLLQLIANDCYKVSLAGGKGKLKISITQPHGPDIGGKCPRDEMAVGERICPVISETSSLLSMNLAQTTFQGFLCVCEIMI